VQPIYRSWYIPLRWVDYIWQLCAVTLAAQVLTIPLCLYHFHQFPVYFLLANLLCVPLSSILLIGCIVLVVISPLPIFAAAIGFCLGKGIKLMNLLVNWLAGLPHSTLSGFDVLPAEVFIAYLLLSAFMGW